MEDRSRRRGPPSRAHPLPPGGRGFPKRGAQRQIGAADAGPAGWGSCPKFPRKRGQVDECGRFS
ncbi:hypothetical protein HMPREF0262_03720 [Clostridium sp. ATCC 29733]|nr:hypothetical protein HMPREF0262_03720 [Clostridium sp. ATCC 29733]